MTCPHAELRTGAIHAQTLFAHTASGRISCKNSPDRSAAPLLWIGGSADGNVIRFRSDLPDSIASEIESLLAMEEPLSNFDSMPRHLRNIQEILETLVPVLEIKRGMSYRFPALLSYDHNFQVTSSDTTEGEDLLARLKADGMPQELFELGFIDHSHFWPPWCVTHDDSRIVSIAFTARLAEAGAEVGVVTIAGSRGRGFAAASVSTWASLSPLTNLTLFYSTDSTNLSSQRVAEKLQLARLGPIFSVYD
jgi:hypothetical protein